MDIQSKRILEWATSYNEGCKNNSSNKDSQDLTCYIRSFEREGASAFEFRPKKEGRLWRLLFQAKRFVLSLLPKKQYDLSVQIRKYEECAKEISSEDVKGYMADHSEKKIGALFQDVLSFQGYIDGIKEKKFKQQTTVSNKLREVFLKASEPKLTQIFKVKFSQAGWKLNEQQELRLVVEGKEYSIDGLKRNIIQEDLGITDKKLEEELLKVRECQIENVLQEKTKQFLEKIWKESPDISIVSAARSVWKEIGQLLTPQEESKYMENVHKVWTRLVENAVTELPLSDIKIDTYDGRYAVVLQIDKEEGKEERSFSEVAAHYIQRVKGSSEFKGEIARHVISTLMEKVRAYGQEKNINLSKTIRSQLLKGYQDQLVALKLGDAKLLSPPSVLEVLKEFTSQIHPQLSDDENSQNIPPIKSALQSLQTLESFQADQCSTMASFFLSEGGALVSQEDQADLLKEVQSIYQKKRDEYHAVLREGDRVQQCLERLSEFEVQLHRVNRTIGEQKEISDDRAARIIVWIKEQKEICETFLKDKNKEIQNRAQKTIQLCKSIITEIDAKRAKDKESTDNKEKSANIHVEGGITINVNNSPGAVVNTANVFFDRVINKSYVSAALAEQELAKKALLKPKSILEKMVGAGISAAAPAFLFGGLPSAATAGVASATMVLVQPLVESFVKKSGASDRTAYWIGFVTSIAMAKYTSQYMSLYLASSPKVISPTSPQEKASHEKEASTNPDALHQDAKAHTSHPQVVPKQKQLFPTMYSTADKAWGVFRDFAQGLPSAFLESVWTGATIQPRISKSPQSQNIYPQVPKREISNTELSEMRELIFQKV